MPIAVRGAKWRQKNNNFNMLTNSENSILFVHCGTHPTCNDIFSEQAGKAVYQLSCPICKNNHFKVSQSYETGPRIASCKVCGWTYNDDEPCPKCGMNNNYTGIIGYREV